METFPQFCRSLPLFSGVRLAEFTFARETMAEDFIGMAGGSSSPHLDPAIGSSPKLFTMPIPHEGISDIDTVHEGCVQLAKKVGEKKTAGIRIPKNFQPAAIPEKPSLTATLPGPFAARRGHQPTFVTGGCSCFTGRFLADLIFPRTSR